MEIDARGSEKSLSFCYLKIDNIFCVSRLTREGTGGFITSWLKELQKKVQTVADEEAYSSSIYGIEKKQFPYMLAITNMLLHDLDVPQIFHDNTLLRDVLDYTDDDKFDVILMNPPYGGAEKADVKSHFPADLASSETADLFMSVIMYRLSFLVCR